MTSIWVIWGIMENGNYSYNGFRFYRGPGLTGVPGKRSSPLGIVEAHPEKNLAEGIFTAALACGRLSSLTSSGHRTTDDGQGSGVHGLGFVGIWGLGSTTRVAMVICQRV